MTLDMISSTYDYAQRADLIRNFVKQDPDRAALSSATCCAMRRRKRKMPEIVPGRPEALKGSAAAAVLLMLFDEDEAAQILSRLEPDEVRQLGYAMYDVQDVEPEEVNEALDHFVNKAKKRTTIGYGATRHIRGAMTKALGEERAETILARITPPTRSTQLEMLKWMDAKEIAVLIEMEHRRSWRSCSRIWRRRSPPTCCSCCPPNIRKRSSIASPRSAR